MPVSEIVCTLLPLQKRYREFLMVQDDYVSAFYSAVCYALSGRRQVYVRLMIVSAAGSGLSTF